MENSAVSIDLNEQGDELSILYDNGSQVNYNALEVAKAWLRISIIEFQDLYGCRWCPPYELINRARKDIRKSC